MISRGINMNSRERLTTAMAPAVPVAQFTPDQQYFRNSIGAGRWQADFNTGASVPMNHVRVGPDGTVDTIRMEPDGDSYMDLGGQGARDMAAGRP